MYLPNIPIIFFHDIRLKADFGGRKLEWITDGDQLTSPGVEFFKKLWSEPWGLERALGGKCSRVTKPALIDL